MSRLNWTRFSDHIPTREDANEEGYVMARVDIGSGELIELECMWDWIPPRTPQVKEAWDINGFIYWRGLTEKAKLLARPPKVR